MKKKSHGQGQQYGDSEEKGYGGGRGYRGVNGDEERLDLWY